MPLFEVLSVPPFTAILVEGWNAKPHRYFLAYRIRGNFRHVLGLPVVDEFATFSSPIFFGPIPLLGQLYNVGISLGHQRDSEMGLDQGWPPICVGLDVPSPSSSDWGNELLQAIKSASGSTPTSEGKEPILQHHQVGGVSVVATNAPLLPRQLLRLCELGDAPLSIAFSTANRIIAQDGKLLSIQVASESSLEQLLHRFSTQLEPR